MDNHVLAFLVTVLITYLFIEFASSRLFRRRRRRN